MLMKSALRDLLSVSYDKIIILLNYLPSADTPPIRLCRTSPASGGRINRSMLSCRDMAPWLSIHSPTAPRGEGGAVRHQRGGCISLARRAVVWFSHGRKPGCKGFIQTGAFYKFRGAPPQPSRQRRVKLKPLKNLRPSGPSTLKPQRGLSLRRPFTIPLIPIILNK